MEIVITQKFIPAELTRLVLAVIMMLDLTVGVGAPFFAGNPSTQKSDAGCLHKIYRSAYEFRTDQGECMEASQGSMKVIGFLTSFSLQFGTRKTAMRIPLDSLWGFRQGDDTFRVLNNRVYRILDDSPMVVYQGTGKYHLRYYFSGDLDGDVYWFSKKNLKKAFFEHTNFLKLLDDGLSLHQLLAYDACKKRFLIQHFFESDPYW